MPETHGEVEGLPSGLHDKWEDLKRLAENQTQKLQSQLNVWRSYNETTDRLHRWMVDMETETRSGTAPRAELHKKKAQLNQLKVLSVM